MDRGRVPGMRIAVVHSTSYRYTSPVYLEPHTIRLRPREDASQRLLNFAMEVSPTPAGRSETMDQDGNVATQVWFTGTTQELVVRSSFEVETLRDNPFDFLLLSGDRDVPLQYAEPLRAALVPYLRAGDDSAVREFARQVAVEAGWETMGFLNALNRKLFESTRQVVR